MQKLEQFDLGEEFDDPSKTTKKIEDFFKERGGFK